MRGTDRVRYYIKARTDEMQAKAVEFLAGRGLKYKVYTNRRLIRAYDLPRQVQDKLRSLGCVVEKDTRQKKEEE